MRATLSVTSFLHFTSWLRGSPGACGGHSAHLRRCAGLRCGRCLTLSWGSLLGHFQVLRLRCCLGGFCTCSPGPGLRIPQGASPGVEPPRRGSPLPAFAGTPNRSPSPAPLPLTRRRGAVPRLHGSPDVGRHEAGISTHLVSVPRSHCCFALCPWGGPVPIHLLSFPRHERSHPILSPFFSLLSAFPDFERIL